MSRRVLMVAFHFPPQMGSSGLLRALKFCRYLPDHDWLPTVLTVHPRAYDRLDSGQLNEIPPDIRVLRTFALDARKHLSIAGRYLRFSAVPDRWASWVAGAVGAGLMEIRRSTTDAIITTFPIASAVMVGYLLHQITGVPWIADFRDSMTEEQYPRDPLVRRMHLWLEKKAAVHAARLIFTARSTMKMYLQRYPDLHPGKCMVIENGYDEQDFSRLAVAHTRENVDRVRIVHSGLIYPEERDPVPFFRALSRLKKEQKINAQSLCVDLRACGNEERYKEIIDHLDVADIVHLLPALPYHAALRDSHQSTALLLMQAACCDHQIPAKAYEYLRLHKPILALISRSGDTAALMNECGGATIIDIADEESIYRGLPNFLSSLRAGTHVLPTREIVAGHSRQNQAGELARCLDAALQVERTDPVVAEVNRLGSTN